MALITIPLGENSEYLQNIIDNQAVSGDIIELTSDMTFLSDSVVIPEGLEIAISSNGGNVFTMHQSNLNVRHFEVSGTLTLRNITLDGGENGGGIFVNGSTSTLNLTENLTIQNCSTSNSQIAYGGGVRVVDGTLYMGKGSYILNNYANNGGGGIAILGECNFTMDGGLISKNRTHPGSPGGGIRFTEAYGTLFIMNDGEISHNITGAGGGIFQDGNQRANLINSEIKNEASVKLDAANYTMETVINGGIITKNQAEMGGGIFISRNSKVTMTDGTISENEALIDAIENSGGGVYVSISGRLLVKGGKIENNTSYDGGGIGVKGGVLNIEDGEITENTSIIHDDKPDLGFGGGISVKSYDVEGDETIITMDGGIISSNTADDGGGGIFIDHQSGPIAFTMTDGIIENNTSNQKGSTLGGGGVLLTVSQSPIVDASKFTMSGGIISSNTAENGNGGGIYKDDEFEVEISGNSFITDNAAINGDGGGIFCEDEDYSILTTGANTVFSCNRAITANEPPVNASTDYPNILFSSTSISDHPLNNYDINNTSEPIISDITFTITYDANECSGSYKETDIPAGDSVTIKDASDFGFYCNGLTFAGWNTKSDGSGKTYLPDDEMIPNCSQALYALWEGEPTPDPKKLCRSSNTRCRTSVEGRKIWLDDSPEDRPETITIILLRDGAVYKTRQIDSNGSGEFSFCCLPKYRNTGEPYRYTIDEVTPSGYGKTINGYNIINNLLD